MTNSLVLIIFGSFFGVNIYCVYTILRPSYLRGILVKYTLASRLYLNFLVIFAENLWNGRSEFRSYLFKEYTLIPSLVLLL